MMVVIMRVLAVLVMPTVVVAASAMRAGHARFMRISFVAGVGNAAIAWHQIKLYRGHHARRAREALRAACRLIELLHGTL